MERLNICSRKTLRHRHTPLISEESPVENAIGIIGVGSMGGALLGRWRAANIHVVAYDVTQAGRERASAHGVAVAANPAELAAQVDAVAVMVRTDAETLDAVLGDDGALAGLADGGLLLLHSTIAPSTTTQIVAAAQSRRIDVVDAPVVGVPAVVEAGRAVAIVGGSQQAFDRAAPLLKPCFRDAIHMGPTGAGNAAKIIKNLCTAAEALVLAEALRIGESWGIDYLDALAMMTTVDQYHFIDHWSTAFDANGYGSAPLRVPNLYDKDVPLARNIAHAAGISVPITEALADSAQQIVAATE
ncbi:NAD(P)-binding domain-containing protein [Gordonia sp. i37]|uniref:NAD(P)-binding domain-containing protein n=1 Tax=Gordonia sp. i37 TaxID=1961707 RepID=UPI0009ACECBA|nr:NAD(P)-binding domain-containing protein [Gordonia sp. i37]